MKIFHALPSSSLTEPHAVTIGMFDGVHTGHQKILEAVKKIPHHSVITFKRHPSHLFHPEHPTPLIYSLEARLALLKNCGIESVHVLEFDRHFAEQTWEAFLHRLKKIFRLSHLVRGEGDAFGKDREGDAGTVIPLAKKLDIEMIYLPKIIQDGHPISSNRIRSLIRLADFRGASQLLGRPYSLTLSKNTDLKSLLLPPPGRYSVQIQKKETELLVEENRLIFPDPLPDEVEIIW